MKNKKGNVAVIVIVIVIIAITGSVIIWLIARKTQVPVAQPEMSIPIVKQPENSESTPIQKTKAKQMSLGEIQFTAPANGTRVQPGSRIDVALISTGDLTLKNIMIMAPGSDSVDLTSPPYVATFVVPADAYGEFVISALGEGADNNLYAASVSVSVNNTATLQKVDINESLYMDLGTQMSISVTGMYSDGTRRDLSKSTSGTLYASGDESKLTVSEDGIVISKAIGVGFVRVTPPIGEPVIVRVEMVEASE